MKKLIICIILIIYPLSYLNADENDSFEVLTYCPALYQILSPEGSDNFDRTYRNLEQYLTFESQLKHGGMSVDYLIAKTFGKEHGIKTLRGFIDSVTMNIKSLLDNGELTIEDIESYLLKCT